MSISIAPSIYFVLWSDRTAHRSVLCGLYFHLARKVAHRWKNASNEPYRDLEQVASIGLLKAIERFELAKGFKFNSYAIPRINGEIHHYIRDRSQVIKIPRQIAKMRTDIRETRMRLIKRGRHLTDREIAIGLNYTDQDLADLSNLSNLTHFDSVESAFGLHFNCEDLDAEYRQVRELILSLPIEQKAAIENRFFKGKRIKKDDEIIDKAIHNLKSKFNELQ